MVVSAERNHTLESIAVVKLSMISMAKSTSPSSGTAISERMMGAIAGMMIKTMAMDWKTFMNTV